MSFGLLVVQRISQRAPPGVFLRSFFSGCIFDFTLLDILCCQASIQLCFVRVRITLNLCHETNQTEAHVLWPAIEILGIEGKTWRADQKWSRRQLPDPLLWHGGSQQRFFFCSHAFFGAEARGETGCRDPPCVAQGGAGRAQPGKGKEKAAERSAAPAGVVAVARRRGRGCSCRAQGDAEALQGGNGDDHEVTVLLCLDLGVA